MTPESIKNIILVSTMTVAAIVVYFIFWQKSSIKFPPENAETLMHWQEPEQKELSGDKGIKYKYGELRFMASFKVSASVLGRKYYDDGRFGEIAPLDLALGWQYMSEPDIYSKLEIKNENRQYFYTGNTQIKPDQILINSANMHVIPSSKDVWQTLKNIEIGDRITLAGFLVNYQERSLNNIFRINTSLLRHDVGEGSGELLYVIAAVIDETAVEIAAKAAKAEEDNK